ncbi:MULTISPECIES: LLM class F420-dependent oxidoreductase [unclassified Streptomyces]|jgi:probable F420-dependent oxidoreductase|uniref:LLM class F420-dependent oxidoreductase n=1 Tax=unclassified Streptomyces TaxID=2593676 RepID=UPI00081B30B3|nr:MULTISPECIES: LLM class F420-dependent oxidoreductase [unclassified Streptomyces]MEE1746378.1 LLM class F420-dependent oxidoreductase [Streptomyces sp. JV184]SCE39987.1 probable F420-dependent oxidoreductase, Rv3093c family [Streptomyces sp. DvalAA-43]
MNAVRWGINLPLPAHALADHRRTVEALPDLGFTDVWTGEGGGIDAFTPLAAAAAWQPGLRLGTGVVPVFTRGPGILAQTAATLSELARGEVLLGIGASVPAHTTALNGGAHDRPLARVRDTVRFLKRALHGEPVGDAYETLSAPGFSLGFTPSRPPKVLVGALRPRMLGVAYGDGDGAVVNLLTAEDVPRVIAAGRAEGGVDGVDGRPLPERETVVKLFVCPTRDAEYARNAGRGFLGWILNQKPYHAFHEWLGRGELLKESYEAHRAGDRRGAAAALPDGLVDALWLHGEPAALRERISRYLHPGVTTLLLYVAPTPELYGRPEALAGLLAELRA